LLRPFELLRTFDLLLSFELLRGFELSRDFDFDLLRVFELPRGFDFDLLRIFELDRFLSESEDIALFDLILLTEVDLDLRGVPLSPLTFSFVAGVLRPPRSFLVGFEVLKDVRSFRSEAV